MLWRISLWLVGKSAASDRRKLSGNSSADAMDIEPGKRRINGFIGIDPKWRLRVNPDEQRHHEHPFQVKNVWLSESRTMASHRFGWKFYGVMPSPTDDYACIMAASNCGAGSGWGQEISSFWVYVKCGRFHVFLITQTTHGAFSSFFLPEWSEKNADCSGCVGRIVSAWRIFFARKFRHQVERAQESIIHSSDSDDDIIWKNC